MGIITVAGHLMKDMRGGEDLTRKKIVCRVRETLEPLSLKAQRSVSKRRQKDC